MRFLLFITILGFSAIHSTVSASGDSTIQQSVESGPRSKHLRPFKSKRELRKFFSKLTSRYRIRGYGYGNGTGDGDAGSAPPSASSATVNVTSGGGGGGGREEQEVITNLQTAGVDEGSIVKLHGKFLVILRRGRLFTVDISKENLRSISTINAYGPDIDPENTWYDEMLISGDNVVVVGFSYDRGGTEIGLFKLNDDGKLSYRSTYHLRSNDYYSSRNYSSRLIGNKLIFYSPLDIDLAENDPFESFPALRRWHKGAKEKEFRMIARSDQIYMAAGYSPDPDDLTLHTVTSCIIGDGLSCNAESVIGPSGNVFYASAENIYVWASTWYSQETKRRNRSILFKMPLNGFEPSAIRVSGSPVDQLSFREDQDKSLNVLVRAESKGDGMWKSEVSEGEVALLRLGDDKFGNGAGAAQRSDYQELEEPDGYSFQNRFVGDYILYGASNYYSNQSEKSRMLFVLNNKTRVLSKLQLEHDVRRIDLLGNDGIVVGNLDDNLKFTSIRLDGSPRFVDSHTVEHAEQGETRSQGYFYKPENASAGMLGLPMIRSEKSKEMASIIFLRNEDLRFLEAGELSGFAENQNIDDCKASCVDWYGDARPIFAKGRIFALLGYELVEGQMVSGRMQETQRLNFAPTSTNSANRDALK